MHVLAHRLLGVAVGASLAAAPLAAQSTSQAPDSAARADSTQRADSVTRRRKAR